MPREKISGVAEPDWTVHVGWSGGSVQIASVNPHGRISDNDGFVKAIDPGWFVTLDRRSINTLIRTLRKARDSAFGRDE